MFRLEPMVISFDVDGTLIDRDNQPREEVIALYRAFEALGYEMWVWSGGGKSYAEFHARRLGLNPDKIFAKDAKLRPHIAIDDMEDADLGTVATIAVPFEVDTWTKNRPNQKPT